MEQELKRMEQTLMLLSHKAGRHWTGTGNSFNDDDDDDDDDDDNGGDGGDKLHRHRHLR